MNRWILGLALLAAFLSGCQSPYGGAWEQADTPASPGLVANSLFDDGKDADLRGRAEDYFAEAEVSGEDLQDPVAERSERKLIYTAGLTVEVARVDEAIGRFIAFVETNGGYMEARRDGAIICRIPAAQYQAGITELRSYGRVLAENQQVDDVTDAYRDLAIRLDNSQRARERLLGLLERAEKVEDILAIEKELLRLTTDIERATAQLAAMADRVAMSSIQAAFVGVAGVDVTQRPRHPSRFSWINRVGVEHVMRWF